MRRRSLGEQALSLRSSADRLVALRHTTAAVRVNLARAIVLRALASIAVRCVNSLLSLFFLLLSALEVFLTP